MVRERMQETMNEMPSLLWLRPGGVRRRCKRRRVKYRIEKLNRYVTNGIFPGSRRELPTAGVEGRCDTARRESSSWPWVEGKPVWAYDALANGGFLYSRTPTLSYLSLSFSLCVCKPGRASRGAPAAGGTVKVSQQLTRPTSTHGTGCYKVKRGVLVCRATSMSYPLK